jgi:hypothetical protein
MAKKAFRDTIFVCITKRRHYGGVNAAPLRLKNVLANANLFSGVLGRGKLRICDASVEGAPGRVCTMNEIAPDV